jgi:hypothetical protein
LVSESQLELEWSESDSERTEEEGGGGGGGGRRKTHPFLGSLHVTTQL